MFDRLVVIRGGGDLGSGTALRLWRCGFPIVILESASPLTVRRTVAFAEAVYEGTASVEEATGRLVGTTETAMAALRSDEISVLVDPPANSLKVLKPYAVVDAILVKRNTGTRREMASVVVGLGPGFCAGRDVDAVVETNRGPNLGRVIWNGEAETNTGEPGPVAGQAGSRVLRAPCSGELRNRRQIGDVVDQGEIIATVEGEPMRAAFPSLVRGLAHDGLRVTEGTKVGDIDPRLDPELVRRVSDKSLAVAGGVLEAILSSLKRTSQ